MGQFMKHKPLRDKLTTEGGGRSYRMQTSKIAKDSSGNPQVVTVEREKMMQKLGYDPGYNVVAMHKTGGSHFNPKGDPFTKGSRAENTSDSNKARAKKFKDKFKTNKAKS